MRDIRSAAGAIMVTAWSTAFGISCAGAPPATTFEPQAGRETVVAEDFQAMMAKVDAAQLEIQNGRPEAFKALWSHADDVTLAGDSAAQSKKDGSRSADGSIGLVRTIQRVHIPTSGLWKM